MIGIILFIYNLFQRLKLEYFQVIFISYFFIFELFEQFQLEFVKFTMDYHPSQFYE